MMKTVVRETPALNVSYSSRLNTRLQTAIYFVVAVLGFSFWFFMAVPFASHRESYEWLAQVQTQDFARAFTFISKTYRPLAQGATWFGFMLLDPGIFPTSVPRQALLQGFIYGMFVLAWWLIYRAADQKRLLAVLALSTGCVFFSGYVHLFHIYGLFYVPVMLILGALFRFRTSGTLGTQEMWLAGGATAMAFWHPFATALFSGFYFGFYLDTFSQRTRAQHLRALAILFVTAMAVGALVVAVPRFWHDAPALLLQTEAMSVQTRLLGFLVSYQTNEVNWIASLVAFLLAQIVVFSMDLSPRVKVAVSLLVCVLSVLFIYKTLPLLLLWLCVVLMKLVRMRCWSLLCLTLTAALLPFGGGIGTPIYALFAIIVGVYVTPMGWSGAEKTLSRVGTPYAAGAIVAAAVVILVVRAGVDVPIVTRLASPLLAERERTYQLEHLLAWLHKSEYCGCEIAFVENAGNPIDSVEGAINRRNRPPAGLKEVQIFWKTLLQCQQSNRRGIAIVTFGGPELAGLNVVRELGGRYAGVAKVWIQDSQK